MALFALAGLSACGSADASDTTKPKLGNLGRGAFRYTCVTKDDSVCPSDVNDVDYANFPTSIVVNGKFKLTFEPSSEMRSSIGNAVLKPASNDYIADDSVDFFTAKKAGSVAVVVRATSSGRAPDFTFVRIAEPTKLKITDTKAVVPPEKVTLHVNDTVTYVAQPQGSRGEALAGSVDFDWSSSDEQFVALVSRPPAARMGFTAKKVTTAPITLKVTLGSVSSTVNVEVVQ